MRDALIRGLKIQMEAKRVSQSELARRMGVTRQYVCRLLKGKEGFSLNVIEKIGLALNCKITITFEGLKMNGNKLDEVQALTNQAAGTIESMGEKLAAAHSAITALKRERDDWKARLVDARQQALEEVIKTGEEIIAGVESQMPHFKCKNNAAMIEAGRQKILACEQVIIHIKILAGEIVTAQI